jgi:hypothetical protein
VSARYLPDRDETHPGSSGDVQVQLF